MNIAIDGRAAKWYRGTGIGTYTYQLINNINQIDFLNSYKIFIPENITFDKKLRDNFCEINVNSQSNTNFWEQVEIPNILTDDNINLYHVPQNGVGLANNINCKKLITLHDIIPLRMPETCSDRYLNIFQNVIPQMIKNIDGIITVSEFSKNDICKEFNYPKEKVFVTYLAAEDIYTPLNLHHCKSILKSKYSIESDFILYVGGFSPRKNILSVIESFSLLRSKLKKDIKLIVVGNKGISYPIYQKRAEELNISSEIIFPGFIPMSDMPIFYNAAQLFVYPSSYEGFGLPPLEAMACGTPVITSTATSIPEVVEDNALLVNPNDIHAIAESMLNILGDKVLASNLIAKGLIHASRFNWKKTAYDTLDAYKHVAYDTTIN